MSIFVAEDVLKGELEGQIGFVADLPGEGVKVLVSDSQLSSSMKRMFSAFLLFFWGVNGKNVSENLMKVLHANIRENYCI